MYRIALLLPVATVLLAGCGTSTERAPVLHRVRPLTVTPGGLLLVQGERLDRVATISIGGHLATNMTVVNPAVLTAVAPADIEMGPQPLELKSYDGSVIGGSVTVAQPTPTATPTRTPAPTRTPPPTRTQPPTRTPSRTPSPTPSPSPSPSRSPTASPSPRPTPRIVFPPWFGIGDDDEDRGPADREKPGRRRGQ